ncbi:hypothetical protein F4810DRAFT_713840 [Camillea tinctor]|nr:hypothetical protein F4810DRAFT_713840 [Camillea tinctor]
MAGITATTLPRNESAWVSFSKNEGIQDPRTASIHDYILPSGSKVANVGFALLRIKRNPMKTPFNKCQRARTQPESISRQTYYDQAERDLAPIRPRTNYLNWIAARPMETPFGSAALALGAYYLVLRSQQRTRGSRSKDTRTTPADFSPMLTRIQAHQALPSQANLDSVRLRSFQLQSNLDLYPPPPEPPQTPTRQTSRGVQSPDAMDTDEGSGQTHPTHTTSSQSTGEDVSPITGVEATHDGPEPYEVEEVISGMTITRTTTEIFEHLQGVYWEPSLKTFTVKDQNGVKSYTAVVDGLVEVQDSTFTGITVEMKRSNRYRGGNYATKYLAQESCEMAAVIHHMPADGIERIRRSGRTAKQVTVAINKNECWFVVLEYTADWADYIRGNSQAPFELASVTEHGPFRTDIKRHMDVFTTHILSLTYAAKHDDLDGFNDDVAMVE